MLGPALRPASAHAATLVEGWWTVSASGSGTVVPDGAIDLIACEGQGIWLAGADTSPRPVQLPSGCQVRGIRLRPGVAAVLVGAGADSATNALVPIDAFVPDHTARSVQSRIDAESQDSLATARLLEGFVTRTVGDQWQPDDLVLAALDAIDRDTPLGELPASERQLRRRFKQATGLGPAMMRRIRRLDRFLALASALPERSNANLAAEAGYFDEAHLARDARSLTNATPSQLRPVGAGG